MPNFGGEARILSIPSYEWTSHPTPALKHASHIQPPPPSLLLPISINPNVPAHMHGQQKKKAHLRLGSDGIGLASIWIGGGAPAGFGSGSSDFDAGVAWIKAHGAPSAPQLIPH